MGAVELSQQFATTGCPSARQRKRRISDRKRRLGEKEQPGKAGAVLETRKGFKVLPRSKARPRKPAESRP
jgi:hypothetical protein